MPIVWSDSIYRLGVEDIDVDHRHKIEALNKVEFLIENGAEPDVVAKALDELIKGTAEHFSHEEKLMKRTKYPAIGKHAELHHEFLERLRRLHADNFSNGGQVDARAELDFFSDWMSVHIQNADRNYVHWLHPEI
jgi:hemerythrin-like metal-binding protein